MSHFRSDSPLAASPRSPSPSPLGSSFLPPPTPELSDLKPSLSTSSFLRTEDTLNGLARQLSALSDDNAVSEDGDAGGMACCCGGDECECFRMREKLEGKLALSGEIGHALLQRYEVLEKRLASEVKRYQFQLDEKRAALADALRRASALDKANATQLNKYAELNRKNETLEKHLTQSLHTQALTQQSLTHVRAELTSLRNTMQRQSIALVSGAGTEERLAEAEKSLQEAQDAQLAAERRERDEAKKVKRAEMRIGDLEGLLQATQRELDELKETRAKDANALLDNAKARLAELHQQLSDTFRVDAPEETPEYQKAMEDLVASNAMLKHDASELSHLLAESRDEVRTLKEELEELRSRSGFMSPSSSGLPAGRISPLGAAPHLAAEIRSSSSFAPYGHIRTGSSPIIDSFDRAQWARASVGSSSRWGFDRSSSMAPSFASGSTTDGRTSPGLGVGAVGEYSGSTSLAGALSPPPSASASHEGGESPKIRSSPTGGIGYVLNGVPKAGSSRPQFRRRASEKPRMSMRSYASTGVNPISEAGPFETDMGHTTDEPLSPASDTFRAADASRKRRSLMLLRRGTYHSISPHDSLDYGMDASQTLVEPPSSDLMGSKSEGETQTAGLPRPSPAKKANRRTILLLTKSKGVQTDPETDHPETVLFVSNKQDSEISTAVLASAAGPEERSETSSLHQNSGNGAGTLSALVDHLSKLLARLRAADVPTLNKRLRKQHLPGDVAHLSRSTLRALETEIGDLRQQFRAIADPSTIYRREWNLLLKLLRDTFSELVDLQGLVNDVTLNPKLAKQLQKEAYRDEEAEEAAHTSAASGLGWIANPITRLFVTPAVDTAEETTTARPGTKIERGRLQPAPPVKTAPKQAAVAGATTTHVSVEFGGTGIVRRATPAGASQVPGPSAAGIASTLPTSPNPSALLMGGDRQVSTGSTQMSTSNAHSGPLSSSPTGIASSTGLRPPNTLRPSKSRANRNELLGIFAGAQRPAVPMTGQPWVVLDAETSRPAPTLRSTSSQHFGISPSRDQTVRARRSPSQRKRLSAVVDAVIDPAADTMTADAPEQAAQEAPFQPLLERTLRSRGLSDSSIRSTFVSQAASNEMGPIIPAESALPQRQAGYAGYGGSLLAGIGRRLYWSKAEVSPINPPPDPADPTPDATDIKASPSDKSATAIPIQPRKTSFADVPAKSPAQAIPVTPKQPAPLSSSLATSTTGAGGGFLSLLATSLAGAETLVGDSDDEGRSPGRHDRAERDELMSASLRQGIMPARTASRGGRRWQ